MSISKLVVIIFFCSISLFAFNTQEQIKTIKPTFILQSKGLVNDFIADGIKLYVANDEGSVEIFDLSSLKKVDEIFINPIYTTKQEWKNCKILSVDRHNGKTLIVSTNKGQFRDVWLHDGKKLNHIIKSDDKLAIKKAKFIDDGKFMFGTLAYEMMLYDTSDNYNAYRVQLEQSAFSDMALSNDKKLVISGSESGQVTITKVDTGEIIKQPKPLNLDNIYQVAYENGTIITAGQDRKVGVYPKDGVPYSIKSNFLVYSVALSPSGQLGIYSSDENSNLEVFNIKTKQKLYKLQGHFAIPSKIKFYDEKGLFSAGYENKIFYWRLD